MKWEEGIVWRGCLRREEGPRYEEEGRSCSEIRRKLEDPACGANELP